MIVYVAGKWEEREEVRRLMDAIENEGHTISHDWTHGSTEGMDEATKREYRTGLAVNCVAGARRADAFVILNNDRGFGQMVELGVALVLNIPVFVLEAKRRDSSFFYHPLVKKCPDMYAVMAHLRML